MISRAIVVVPSSLVDNWANEIRKWLGNHRLEVLAMQSSANAKQQRIMIDDFVSGARWPVLIISYGTAAVGPPPRIVSALMTLLQKCVGSSRPRSLF